MEYLAYDTETTGLRPWQGDEMFAYSTCDPDGRTEVERIDGTKLRQLQGMKALAQLWADYGIAKVMHNAKFDMIFTEKALGQKLNGHEIHCTHKMSHILQNHHYGHSLENIAWDLAEYPKVDSEIRKLAKVAGGYDKVAEHKMEKYQRMDAERTMLLFLFFWPKIQANPEWLDCYQTEMDLIWTTMRMEESGLALKPEITERMILSLEDKIDNAREQLFEQTGERFNPLSDIQLTRILYGQLNFPVLKRTAKSRKPSTNKHVLLQLRDMTAHPVIDLILQIRSYTKGIATLEKYLELADSDFILHPNINTCAAITSRESVTDPALQTVSKTNVMLNPFPVAARECFGPKPGMVNLHIDYKGIEMRLLVHYSRDPKMLECMNIGDGDVHALAARVFYGAAFDRADSKERSRMRGAGKNANFACPYGAGKAQVMKTLGLYGPEGAAAFMRYQKTFPTLVGLSRTISEWVRNDGFITTTFGRRLHVSKDKPYVGTNYLIQGTAAGVIKRAQNRVHAYNETQTGGEVKCLLPIHDEIIIEYPEDQLDELPYYLQDVSKLMLDFPMFDVPLDIEVEISRESWEKKRPYKARQPKRRFTRHRKRKK